MLMISTDYLVATFRKQLKEKRDDTIKCIDNTLQSVNEIKHADKDIIFNDISNHFIHELSTTLTTIEATLKELYPGINIPKPVNDLLIDIKTLRYFTGFLTNFTDDINDYKHARKEFNRWTIE